MRSNWVERVLRFSNGFTLTITGKHSGEAERELAYEYMTWEPTALQVPTRKELRLVKKLAEMLEDIVSTPDQAIVSFIERMRPKLRDWCVDVIESGVDPFSKQQKPRKR